MSDRLTIAEINLTNFAHNFNSVRDLAGPQVKIMAVVKANAYGHGAVEISKQSEKLGSNYLGVVCLYEAKQLRMAGIKIPILILNYSDSEVLEPAVDSSISLNIMDETLLKDLDKIAHRKNKIAKIHVKVDTGMHRLGLSPEQALKFIPRIENYKNIFLEGIFSHFASSDETNLSFAREQLEKFNKIISSLAAKGIRPPLIHFSNSAGTLRLPESHYDLVRPGIILYGLPPSQQFRLPFVPRPVLTLKTQIVQIRLIHKGETVGYGRTFRATKDTIVAALPVGYADGFRRAPNNWSKVLVRGKRAPLLGRVSMDQTSINITQIPDAKIGDEVVLIGKQGSEEINCQEVAKNLGTINYEVVSSLAARVSRVYVL